jgi:hypothetical protein
MIHIYLKLLAIGRQKKIDLCCVLRNYITLTMSVIQVTGQQSSKVIASKKMRCARFIALTAKQRAKGFFNESRKTGKLTALALDAPAKTAARHALATQKRKQQKRGAASHWKKRHLILRPKK